MLEYLWKAAWCLFKKRDNAVEKWIEKRAIKILNSQCNQVAKGIQISATRLELEKQDGINKCAQYLLKNKEIIKLKINYIRAVFVLLKELHPTLFYKQLREKQEGINQLILKQLLIY